VQGRKGSCSEGCGACCTFVTLCIHPAYAQSQDVKNWLSLHGITLKERNGQVWANVPLPCGALNEDKSCSLFGQPERPKLCSEWPFNQQEINDLHDEMGRKVCTFYFSEGD
jgi:Fe-S-cluster containining protein